MFCYINLLVKTYNFTIDQHHVIQSDLKFENRIGLDEKIISSFLTYKMNIYFSQVFIEKQFLR